MKISLYWASLILLTGATSMALEQQKVFIASPTTNVHGKFLHITDIHMDKHYISGATVKSNCHREPNNHKKKKKDQGPLAGYWGTPTSDCDAPPRLVYHSIDYIAREWKHKIDFIIWTGDNARHDGDSLIPRTGKEIISYNEKVTKLLKTAFTLDNSSITLPIVPNIGNNDIHPHNELRGMKHNPQLLKFSKIWSDFIPHDQVKAFKRGGYFAIDVVPGRIRVLSLNTLYFFGSNDVVNSCSDKNSAGARHVTWFSKQLKRASADGVKVIITGHVPPTIKTFKDNCLDSYIKLSTRHSDIIVGHMYGHANLDHFQILGRQFSAADAADDDDDTDANDNTTVVSKDPSRFVSTLRAQYKKVKKVRDIQDLVVVHIAPPLIPLLYPTFRINEYKTSVASSNSQFGDWLKYTQYYTNLTYWNEQRDPVTRKHLAPEFEVEYATDDSIYNMTNLTASSWLDLAVRLTSKKAEDKELWKNYLSNMFVRTGNDWYGQSVPPIVEQPPTSIWRWLIGLVQEFFGIHKK